MVLAGNGSQIQLRPTFCIPFRLKKATNNFCYLCRAKNATYVNKNLSNFLKFLLFLGIGLTILYLLYQNQEAAFQAQQEKDGLPVGERISLMQKLIADFKSANYFWVGIVLLAFCISNLSRAIRWNMLLSPMGYQPRLINSFLTINVAYFANLGLPRIGEVVRAGVISRYEKIPMEKAVGTIVTDRIVDVLSLATVIGLAFLLEYDVLWGWLSEQMGSGEKDGGSLLTNPIVLILLGGMLLTGILFFAFRKTIRQSALFKKIKNILKGFAEGIQSIRKLENPGLFLFHSVNIWLMYFAMTYLCFFAFVPTAHLGPLAGLMVFAFGAFGVLIPSPGGMGTFHFLAMAALALYGIAEADAFSFANILFFSVQIGCSVLIGILALILLPIINRNYRPVVPEEAAVVTEKATT